MPSLPGLSKLEVVPQSEDSAECVPACVATILSICGYEVELEQCCTALGTSDLGTDLAELQTGLDRLGLEFNLSIDAVALEQLEDAEAALSGSKPLPVLARIRADPQILGYQGISAYCLETFHAVVIVAIDSDWVKVLDPDSPNRRSTYDPTDCSRVEFERIWDVGYVILIS